MRNRNSKVHSQQYKRIQEILYNPQIIKGAMKEYEKKIFSIPFEIIKTIATFVSQEI